MKKQFTEQFQRFQEEAMAQHRAQSQGANGMAYTHEDGEPLNQDSAETPNEKQIDQKFNGGEYIDFEDVNG